MSLSPTMTLPRPSRPPIGRLARVELRKLHDTRSGFWLILGSAVVTAAVCAIGAFTADPGGQDLPGLLTLSLFPMGILLPIVGILGMTAEWSQRTALQTFTAVPQRERIVGAKVLAALALGLAGFVVSILVAVVFSTVAPNVDGGSLTAGDLGQGLLFAELSVLTGVAFGMLFGSPAVAIVVYFVAPTVFSALGALISWLGDARDWLDTTIAWGPLSEFTTNGQDWWQALTAGLLWLALPAAIGLWLLRRREVS